MTNEKALKRDARACMGETGEANATARHVLRDRHFEREVATEIEPVAAEQPLPQRVAEPGMSDDAIRRGTGRTWDEMFARLDAWGASERTHPEIASFAAREFGIGGWWAQTVTVGYERARGLRRKNERTDGYSVNVSRTFPVPLARLYAAIADDAARSSWLEPEAIRVRTVTLNKAWRCEMVEDDSRVEFRFTAKAPNKTAIAIEQTRLATEYALPQWRAFWKARLDRLAGLTE